MGLGSQGHQGRYGVEVVHQGMRVSGRKKTDPHHFACRAHDRGKAREKEEAVLTISPWK